MPSEIGLVGLGTMGAALALNIAEKGFPIAVFNRTTSVTRAFAAEAGPLAPRITPCEDLPALVAALERPRAIILMVPAGAPVDQMIAALRPLLDRDDLIIDCGNANFHDTRRRAAEAEAQGSPYLGVGVSGGEEGARHGPSIMAGGPQARLGPRRADPRGHRRPLRGHPLRHLDGSRRRRPLRQDGAQRHRIRRHADDRRDLRHHARRPRLRVRGGRPGLRGLEPRPAEILPDRDHRRGGARHRPGDRPAGHRHHPRPRRPEGHRPLDRDRGAAPRRARHRHRGRGRRPQHLRPRRGARPAARTASSSPPAPCRATPRSSTGCRRRSSPARSPATPRASASSPPPPPSSAGRSPWRASPGSGAPAASSARRSSTTWPGRSRPTRPSTSCSRRASPRC